MANEPVRDPWLEDDFAPLDLTESTGLQQEIERLQQQQPEEQPEPTPAPAPEGPTVTELQDGGTLSITKTQNGWEAVLDSGTGGTETFRGGDRDELLFKIATAKLNATKKIRQLNRDLKLGRDDRPQPQQQPEARPQSRQLTVDDVAEIQTQLKTNPDLALDSWFQKKTGLTVEQMTRMAGDGQRASEELQAEAVAKGFVAAYPDYYPDPTNKNFTLITAFLAKNKIGLTISIRRPNPVELDSAVGKLVRAGEWTVENLSEAYEELSEAGLLETAPAPEYNQPARPLQEAQPAQPAEPNDERIVRTVRRPRAGLGIRTNEATASLTVPSTKPPSVEDMDSLSDDEISKLLQGVRVQRAHSLRP